MSKKPEQKTEQKPATPKPSVQLDHKKVIDAISQGGSYTIDENGKTTKTTKTTKENS